MKQYDVNNDGKVNKQDAKMVQEYLAGLFDLSIYDVNNDGEVDLGDYMEWRRHFDFSDIDNNGVINQKDVEIIQKAILNKVTTWDMDLNNDNVVDMNDVCKLQFLLDRTTSLYKSLDILNDGEISKEDGAFLRQMIDACRKFLKQLDVNKDGEINMHDVVDIQQHKD